MASSTHDQPAPEPEPSTQSSNTPFDLPPESFWVPKGDENDWLNQNATIERKSSRKLRFFSTQKPVSSGSVFSPVQKANTSLIGFPTGQQTAFPNGNQRQNKTGNMYLFRSRSEPGGKPRLQLQVTEPASPQVSCLGRIGTKRERAKKTGIWRSIVTMLRIRFKMQRMGSKEKTGSVEPESNGTSVGGLNRVGSAKRSESLKFEG